jgi:hypothetical protein
MDGYESKIETMNSAGIIMAEGPAYLGEAVTKALGKQGAGAGQKPVLSP